MSREVESLGRSIAAFNRDVDRLRVEVGDDPDQAGQRVHRDGCLCSSCSGMGPW